MRVFTLIDCYLPGFKHGGPIRTLSSMVARMPDEFQFWIYTRDRDRGDKAPYPNVTRDVWNDFARAKVFYASFWSRTAHRISREIQRVEPDVVYSNSLFSRVNIQYMLWRWARVVPRIPFVLAPRGELARGALALKAWKKRPFLKTAKELGLFDDVIWQASSDLEREDILRALSGPRRVVISRNICVAPDLVSAEQCGPVQMRGPVRKRPGAARFVFLSRVARMKNLPFAINAMRRLRGEVIFDIYGPLDDPGCWRDCQEAMAKLPSHVRVRHHGAVDPERVLDVFWEHEFSVLPTMGENFGHVIFEALCAGCPVVLSDRTLWRRLRDDGAGWVLSLDDEAAWTEALQACVDMGPDEYARMRAQAQLVALRVEDTGTLKQNVELFEAALGSGDPEKAVCPMRSKAPPPG